jgi:hypothetical protein
VSYLQFLIKSERWESQLYLNNKHIAKKIITGLRLDSSEKWSHMANCCPQNQTGRQMQRITTYQRRNSWAETTVRTTVRVEKFELQLIELEAWCWQDWVKYRGTLSREALNTLMNFTSMSAIRFAQLHEENPLVVPSGGERKRNHFEIWQHSILNKTCYQEKLFYQSLTY